MKWRVEPHYGWLIAWALPLCWACAGEWAHCRLDLVRSAPIWNAPPHAPVPSATAQVVSQTHTQALRTAKAILRTAQVWCVRPAWSGRQAMEMFKNSHQSRHCLDARRGDVGYRVCQTEHPTLV